MSGARFHRLRVAEVVAETDDARSIVFELPAALADTFVYKPGQFLTLRVPHENRTISRCYSASSTPVYDEPLRVTVKRVAGGRASNWLCEHLRAGDELDVAAPAGLFTPRHWHGDFVLLGGGSGITPVYSILRSALAQGHGRIFLLYANRDEDSVIFARELARLARENPGRLHVVHWLDSVQGYASAAQLGAACRDFLALADEPQAFICGPAPFMDAAQTALHDLGMKASQVHVERFVSLPDDEDDTPIIVPGDEGAQMEVHLDGKTHQVPVAPGQLLIDAMEAAGLQIPYSCRAGACAACMCQLESGGVEMRRNDALDRHDMDRGWILCCQAQATTPELAVRFPDA